MTTWNIFLLYNVQYQTNNWFVMEIERESEKRGYKCTQSVFIFKTL